MPSTRQAAVADAVLAPPARSAFTGSTVLKSSAAFWWFIAFLGQWAFLYYIVALYGVSTATGNFQAWSKNTLLFKGYVPGDTAGNLAFATHALLAGVIAFGGTLQLIPRLRRRAPALHRWNGRLFVVTALGASLSGLYLVWVRHSNPSLVGELATTLNAILIVGCVALAWRAARARDFDSHRRWALRLFLVANAQWFMRVGVFAWIIVNQVLGTPKHVGAFFLVWNFGCYLVPLTVLEFYLYAKDNAGPRGRYAMAGGLLVLTVLTTVGIVGVGMFLWSSVLMKV